MRSAYALWAMADALRGRPSLATIIPAGPLASRDVLCLAASLDQVSRHVLAGTVVAAAARQCELVLPERVEEDDMDIADLRGLLYGLHAILRLHTAQEDESYLSLGDDTDAAARAMESGKPARSFLRENIGTSESLPSH